MIMPVSSMNCLDQKHNFIVGQFFDSLMESHQEVRKRFHLEMKLIFLFFSNGFM